MLDLKVVKNAAKEVAAKLKTRGFDFDIDEFKRLETKRKNLQIEVESLKSQRNASAKAIGKAKAENQDTIPLLAEVSALKQNLSDLEIQLQRIQTELTNILTVMPNIPLSDVPLGQDETENLEVRIVGIPQKFTFTVKDHVQLGADLGKGLDFTTASKITGSRFTVMRGKIARLHRALTQFMLDVHIEEHGFDEVYVPYVVNEASLFGTGQLPKFKADLFNLKITDTLAEDETTKEMYLIPTAEVPVTNIYRDTISNYQQLPIKHVCHTPCFRSEAGSYGRDTKGLIRQHQFEKVEMVMLVEPEKSISALEELTQYAENVLQKLNLPYRVVSLCTGDLGFSSAKTYDLEVWLPSQNTYREISSCSNFLDFQARRMKARFRSSTNAKPELLHTLNGSGLAVGRTLVAIMENYQNADGSISIPKILQPLMGGLTKII